jgi:hypothetical protein
MGFVSKNKKRTAETTTENGKTKINQTDIPNLESSNIQTKSFPVSATNNRTKKPATNNDNKPTKTNDKASTSSNDNETTSTKSDQSNSSTVPIPDIAISNSKHSWTTANSQRWFQFEKVRATLEIYVKDELFCTLKFVSSPVLMQYSSESRSLCQVVCKKMNVEPEDKEGFWSMYSNIIKKN